MIRFIENENEMLSPEEARQKLKDEGSLVDKVRNSLEDPDALPPSLQYDSAEDPEFSEQAVFHEGFKRVFSEKSHLTEKLINGFNVKQAFKDFVKSKGGNVSIKDFDEFYDKCEEGYSDWGTNSNRKRLYRAFTRNLNKLGVSTESNNDDFEEEKEPFDITKTSKTTQNFVEMYSDYVDSVDSVKEAVDAKYDAIYDVVANIIEGKSFKKHAFICGDAGVGKSGLGNTKISIRVNEIIAEEIKAYLDKKK